MVVSRCGRLLHLHTCFQDVFDFKLSEEDVAAIDKLGELYSPLAYNVSPFYLLHNPSMTKHFQTGRAVLVPFCEVEFS